MESGVRSVEVIVVEVVGQEASAVVAGVVGTCVGPLAGDGLDEAFGLAIGLGAIGTSEEMTQAEIFASGGEEFRAIG